MAKKTFTYLVVGWALGVKVGRCVGAVVGRCKRTQSSADGHQLSGSASDLHVRLDGWSISVCEAYPRGSLGGGSGGPRGGLLRWRCGWQLST